jgi:hypothetical protein
LRLQSAKGYIITLGHIEDHGVSMKLRCGVTVDGTSGVMLELRSDKLPGGFGSMVAADPGLCVPLQLIQSNVDGLAVRFANAVIAADKRR